MPMLERDRGPVSTAPERARFVLAEKALPWTSHPVDPMAGARHAPAFGARPSFAVAMFDVVAAAAIANFAVRVDFVAGEAAAVPAAAAWTFPGFTSTIRYATSDALRSLRAIQQPLGRPAATFAAMNPIRKSAAWWDLPQDDRRAIFEETSHHTAIGLEYLPPIARQLHHCRDLGEMFDFATWFEYAAVHEAAFDYLLARLRATREWAYVEREVDIRLEG
jgi:hypothetical protein